MLSSAAETHACSCACRASRLVTCSQAGVLGVHHAPPASVENGWACVSHWSVGKRICCGVSSWLCAVVHVWVKGALHHLHPIGCSPHACACRRGLALSRPSNAVLCGSLCQGGSHLHRQACGGLTRARLRQALQREQQWLALGCKGSELSVWDLAMQMESFAARAPRGLRTAPLEPPWTTALAAIPEQVLPPAWPLCQLVLGMLRSLLAHHSSELWASAERGLLLHLAGLPCMRKILVWKD